MTYPNLRVFETLRKGMADSLLMLLLDDARGGVEDTEGRFALSGVIGSAQLEEDGKQFVPLLV